MITRTLRPKIQCIFNIDLKKKIIDKKNNKQFNIQVSARRESHSIFSSQFVRLMVSRLLALNNESIEDPRLLRQDWARRRRWHANQPPPMVYKYYNVSIVPSDWRKRGKASPMVRRRCISVSLSMAISWEVVLDSSRVWRWSTIGVFPWKVCVRRID